MELWMFMQIGFERPPLILISKIRQICMEIRFTENLKRIQKELRVHDGSSIRLTENSIVQNN